MRSISLQRETYRFLFLRPLSNSWCQLSYYAALKLPHFQSKSFSVGNYTACTMHFNSKYYTLQLVFGGKSKFVCSDYRSIKPHRLHTTRLSPNSGGCSLLQRVYLFFPANPSVYQIQWYCASVMVHGKKPTQPVQWQTCLSLMQNIPQWTWTRCC